MTSIIKFTALSGAQNEDPNCYLLQVDEFTFLLDCGWDESFSDTIIKKIRRHMGQIDAMLLSFPDAQHLACLPYLVGKMGMNCPIYATVPVYKMGQMFMYDLYQSHHNTEDFDKFTLDDVDLAFDRIIQLKHNQTVVLKDKGHGLSITPIHAAHIIGGTSWKIVKADEEGEIVYAVDFNHKRERHLNGCTLLESVGGGVGRGGMLGSACPPQLLITDAYNASYQQARRKLRDEELLTKIIETMRADGNVLIAVDTAGRVLELAILLDQLWRDARSGLCAYSLAMINNVTYNVVEFAKSMMEWMSEKIINSFTDQRNSPFQFKHLKLCHNLGDLAQVPHPKCVLASTTDMESGFSRQLFVRWCSDPRNSVIITGRTAKGTLARTLIDDPTVSSLNLEIRKRIPIVGEELDEYERKKSARKALEKKNLEDESSDESDSEEAAKGAAVKHDLMISTEPSKKGGAFFKQAKKTYPMYPYVEIRKKWDDYGEVINPDDYRTSDPTGNEEESQQSSHEQLEEKKSEETKDEEDSEVPTKCICEVRTLEVKCSVTYIDFEGRSDGESMLKIIQQIKPKEVILVRGTTSNTMRFADILRRSLGGDISAPGLMPAPQTSDSVQVFTPAVDEVVDTTKERHIYQVKLRDTLVNTLRFFKTKDAEVCWLDSKLDFTEAVMNSVEVLSANQIRKSQSDPLRRASQDDEAEFAEEKVKMEVEEGIITPPDIDLADVETINAIPTLVPLQADEIQGHGTYFINELRLSDFKQILMKEGIQAEFIGGVLVCNNSVAIRRNQQGLVDMEGCLSEDYYHIRQLLYSQYAIL